LSTTPLHDGNANDVDRERYLLVSVEAANAPEGCSGADWFIYRIAQGTNAITGYRRGHRTAVSTEVEKIVAGLNDRRAWSRPSSKAQRRAASQIRLGGAQ
jgi:hypothetical protein